MIVPSFFPFNDHFSKIDSQLAMFYGSTLRETQPLHCTYHMLYQIHTDSVVYGMVSDQQLP